ncbi:MAG: hypothetical protein ACRDUX_07105, partial [Mycobacterium sp.]
VTLDGATTITPGTADVIRVTTAINTPSLARVNDATDNRVLIVMNVSGVSIALANNSDPFATNTLALPQLRARQTLTDELSFGVAG